MSPTIEGAMSTAAVTALTEELRCREPRFDAAREIEITPVPMRTCYETMTRLRGPREAVMDYAAYLFAAEHDGSARPNPPLAIEEAHVDGEANEMTLVLSRGTYGGEM